MRAMGQDNIARCLWSGMAGPLFLLLVACPARDPATAPTPSDPVSSATVGAQSPAELYAGNCSHCHEGQTPKAPHSVTFQLLGPEAILAALTRGAMQSQGAALSAEERTQLAEYLGGGTLAVRRLQPPLACAPGASPFDAARPPVIDGWGMTLAGTRFVAAEFARLASTDVPKLELEWAFAFPGATRARSQPTVAAGAIYVGSQDGHVYALDFASGCMRWSFAAQAEVRVAISVEPWEGGDRSARPRAFFGDFAGNVYALDARSGDLLWKHRVDEHPHLTITGTPRYHAGKLYVPMSSTEWAAAADPAYQCCSFRGGVAALDAATGHQVWKTYSIAQEPRLTGETTSVGTHRRGPAGAPVWNSPTIDVKRGRLYVGTGEAYTSPAAPTSDAVLAIDLPSGKLLWHYQSIAGDAWNMACFIGGGPNCPRENGPDLDIGAPPMLVQLENGRDILVIGQKSADVFALDPGSGSLLWRRRTGRGGFAGGVHWGMAAEGARIYVPNADTLFLPTDAQRGVAKPGLFALDALSGKLLWFTSAPDHCGVALKPACDPGLSAPATGIPGVVFAGGFDGRLRAYEGATGRVLWEYDTNREFDTLSGERARGGSIESAGPLVVDGAVLINSGYLFGGRMPGNVLLKFSVPKTMTASRPGLRGYPMPFMNPAD